MINGSVRMREEAQTSRYVRVDWYHPIQPNSARSQISECILFSGRRAKNQNKYSVENSKTLCLVSDWTNLPEITTIQL